MNVVPRDPDSGLNSLDSGAPTLESCPADWPPSSSPQSWTPLFPSSSPQPEKVCLLLGHGAVKEQRVVIEKVETKKDFERLQADFADKQKELLDLRSAHGRLQKVLSEKGAELSHAMRKAESYEREARKLKYKLEEARKRGKKEETEF